MKKSILLTFTLATLTLAQPIFGAENPWFGTWKMNRDKSTLTGTTFTVVKTGNVYHFDYGAVKFQVADDGKDYPVMPTRTTSLRKTGDDEWLVVGKTNGVETSRTVLKLKDGGKAISETTTGTRADGSTYKSEETNVRTGPGPDISGTWKDTKESSSADSVMVYSDGGAGKLKVDYPSSKGSATLPLDGTAVSETGPRAIPGMTYSYKKVSPTELKYTVLFNGKPYVQATQTVSADGKVLKDVGYLVSKPKELTTEVFEKQ